MKKEVIIPSGIKATMYQDGDKVVIEYEEKKEWSPKIGEVCYWSGCNPCFCIITNKCPYYEDCFKVIRVGKYDDKDTSANIKYLRPTTPDERATFFADLKKEGYKWDSKKMVLKKIEEVFVPKDGDFCISTGGGVCIYHAYGAFFYEGILFTPEVRRLATPSEKQFLLDAMHKEGKDWDAVNKKVVDYVWKPKKGEEYYIPQPASGDLYEKYMWSNDDLDNRWHKSGLIYRTKEEAVARAKRMLNTK